MLQAGACAALHAGAVWRDGKLLCRYRVASALGIPFMEINGVPLRINPMQLKNAFVTPQALTKKLSQHLYFQVRPTPLLSTHCIQRCQFRPQLLCSMSW